jgi:hypothetical protein
MQGLPGLLSAEIDAQLALMLTCRPIPTLILSDARLLPALAPTPTKSAESQEICPGTPQALLLPHPLPRIAALPPMAVLSQPHILRSDLQRKSLSFAPKILSPRSLAPQESTKLRAPIFLASPLSSGKLHWPPPL